MKRFRLASFQGRNQKNNESLASLNNPNVRNGLVWGGTTSTKATKNTKGFSTPKTVDLMPLGGNTAKGGWNVLGMWLEFSTGVFGVFFLVCVFKGAADLNEVCLRKNSQEGVFCLMKKTFAQESLRRCFLLSFLQSFFFLVGVFWRICRAESDGSPLVFVMF